MRSLWWLTNPLIVTKDSTSMEMFYTVFGEGKDLSVVQMSCRAIIVFLIAYGLIRVSGRRSFAIHTPVDNIVVILLGAILSRAVVGASPFIPVVCASLTLVLLHRIFGWFMAHNTRLGRWIESRKIILYQDARFIEENMKKALVRKEDIMQGIRQAIHTEDLTKIDKIYIEGNGKISILIKEV
ncbi:hypothetical protein QNI19_12500 [Cytophagaceae bacterium DM2B3-1]|uniref:YetF C-terminal domain-containing protein n=1 Tax=Xanthocytophaga flava TaxID=3048013 RepID=A0ABT7CJ54_9BACT|nr:YetF domain-containing protein [Xanthocytophaga flavus]MDJ1493753.1 hypothetical protein [Xanthocytophaga flavus]